MLKKIIIVFAGIIASMETGAVLALWQCSQRKWCPRYLRRQLDAWHKQISQQNAERQALDNIKILRGRQDIPPPDNDEAA